MSNIRLTPGGKMHDILIKAPIPIRPPTSAQLLHRLKKAGVDIDNGKLPEIVHEVRRLRKAENREFWAGLRMLDVLAWFAVGVLGMMVAWWL